jgi:hypothetical protein
MSLFGRALLIGLALIVAACAALGVGLRAPSAAAREQSWEQAQLRWAARDFSRYRMVVQAPAWCRAELEVRDERAVSVAPKSCPSAPRTVSELFDTVKQLNSQADRTYCAPGGCECLEQRFVVAAYDPQLGFPSAIRLRRARSTNWPELWHHMVTHGLPNCLNPLDTDVVKVLAFQPLQ